MSATPGARPSKAANLSPPAPSPTLVSAPSVSSWAGMVGLAG